MSKQVKTLVIIWVVAGLVAVGAFVYINHAVNALLVEDVVGTMHYDDRSGSVQCFNGTDWDYCSAKSSLTVIDNAPSNIEGTRQSDGGDTDIQPALGYKALTWTVRGSQLEVK